MADLSIPGPSEQQPLRQIANDIETSAIAAMRKDAGYNSPEAKHLWDVLGKLSTDEKRLNQVAQLLVADSKRELGPPDYNEFPKIEIVYEHPVDGSAGAGAGAMHKQPTNSIVAIDFIRPDCSAVDGPCNMKTEKLQWSK